LIVSSANWREEKKEKDDDDDDDDCDERHLGG
jgi:hypothetical protein